MTYSTMHSRIFINRVYIGLFFSPFQLLRTPPRRRIIDVRSPLRRPANRITLRFPANTRNSLPTAERNQIRGNTTPTGQNMELPTRLANLQGVRCHLFHVLNCELWHKYYMVQLNFKLITVAKLIK